MVISAQDKDPGVPSAATMHLPILRRWNKNTRLSRLGGWDFPDGPVVNNPPANAGDIDLIPGPGRVHKVQGN